MTYNIEKNKYNIKYLVKKIDLEKYFHIHSFNTFYKNIDNFELNNENQIEIELSKLSIYYREGSGYKFCCVQRNGCEYFGFTEMDFNRFKENFKYQYENLVALNKIKLIKDLIIEEIIE